METVSEDGKHRSLLQKVQRFHVPAFVAGVTLILLLMVLQRGMETSIGLNILGHEIVSPIRMTLVGIGTGYYLGEALHQNHTGIVVFHIGAFLSLLILAIVSVPFPLMGVILAIAVLFSLSMNVSSLVEEHEDIKRSFDLVARDISRIGIIFVVSMQFIVSAYSWSEHSLSEYTSEDKIIIAFLLILIFYLSYSLVQALKKS